jgi:hypothetical protein
MSMQKRQAGNAEGATSTRKRSGKRTAGETLSLERDRYDDPPKGLKLSGSGQRGGEWPC